MKRKRDSAETGFTLAEVLVATLLLLIVMAGFLPVFLQGLSQTTAARFKSVATNIAREKIERIRQLDYREIQQLVNDPTNPRNLSALFGSTEDVQDRNMVFQVLYEVLPNDVTTTPPIAGQAVKSVQVTVKWTGPPASTPYTQAVVKTLVAQQYLGPRGAWLEVLNTTTDPLGTPFPVIPNYSTTAKYHIAQADWVMAYATLSLPLPAPQIDVSMTSLFVSDTQQKEGRVDADWNALRTASAGNPAQLSDVWFEYSIDVVAGKVPDGYWDLRVTMFKAYTPGNTWVMRVRVEKGPPLAPTNFVATYVYNGTVGSSNQIYLTWLPGAENDRAKYVLERRKSTDLGHTWGDWIPVNSNLPPNTSFYTNTGSLGTTDPTTDPTDPWGDTTHTNYYQYRLYGVDIAGNSGYPSQTAMSGAVYLPPPPAPVTTTTTETGVVTTSTTRATTTTVSGTTSTTIPALFTVTIDNLDDNDYDITIKNSAGTIKYGPERVKKNKSNTVSLPNGTYNLYLTDPIDTTKFLSFTINGGILTVNLPVR